MIRSFYKHPFTVRDASNKQYLRAMEATADLFYKVNHEMGPWISDSLLLEEFGQSLIQSAWRDETGFYVTYRIAPLDAARKVVREAATAIINRWKALFRDVRDTTFTHDETNDRFTVAVFTNCHSIGD